MYCTQLRFTLGLSVYLTLFASQGASFAQDANAHEKAAREAAVAYAKAYNIKENRVAGVMKVAAVPFFAGGFDVGGSGPQIPIHAQFFKEDQELRQWLEKPINTLDFSLKVLRVEHYADFRKKYLEKEPAPGDMYDMRLRLQQAWRWALDESLGKDGLIVFLGDQKEISQKKNISQGILVRFEKGTAKVGGLLGGANPDWTFSVLKFINPIPEKKK
jgi:hypothetical protein